MRDMLGRGRAVSVGEALRLILESISQTNIPHVKVPLVEAFGRVLAGDIVSPEDLPGCRRLRSIVQRHVRGLRDFTGISKRD
jgi:molybdopterin biosynthesis enzyme